MTNKTTEALKLAEEALDELRYANDTDIAKTKYYKALAAIREALAEPVKLTDEKGRPLTFWGGKAEPVKRPQNCGTGYCSCIECIYGDNGCVADEEQCNDGCLAQKSAIADASKLADEIDAEFSQGRISNHNGRKAAQMLRMLVDAPVQPVKQDTVSIPDHITCPFCESNHVPYWLHDLKLDAKAIRAEALETAAKWCEENGPKEGSMKLISDGFAQGIRSLK